MNSKKINTNPVLDFVDQMLNKSISDVVNKDFTCNKPAVNIIETDEKYILQFAVPGLRKEDFKIGLNNDKLTVSTQVVPEPVDKENRIERKEFDFGIFSRSFVVPKNVNKTKIKASYKMGILQLKLTKFEENTEKEKRNIEIE